MTSTLFVRARVFDGRAKLDGDQFVEVRDRRIVGISKQRPTGKFDQEIDCSSRTLMPGLIDAHVHVYAFSSNLSLNDGSSVVARTLHAEAVMTTALMRGFTTLRDAGGADRELADALANRMFEGPRLFYSGKALSQTGGHGDFRIPGFRTCGCGYTGAISVLADNEDEVRKAAREQLRTGATQIKIMASGGTASPSDPIWMLQYSEREISAAVEEAERWGTYVMAHAYTPPAIIRCVKLGARSVEHANLIDSEAAGVVAEHGAFVVPTLSTYAAILEYGPSQGWGEDLMAKTREVAEAGQRSLSICEQAGVKMGFGTDLLGSMHIHQCEEFRIRGEVLPAISVLRSATSINAELLQRVGELGEITPGALADLIIVDGDPLEDLSLFRADGSGVPLVMKDGEIMKNQIGT